MRLPCAKRSRPRAYPFGIRYPNDGCCPLVRVLVEMPGRRLPKARGFSFIPNCSALHEKIPRPDGRQLRVIIVEWYEPLHGLGMKQEGSKVRRHWRSCVVTISTRGGSAEACDGPTDPGGVGWMCEINRTTMVGGRRILAGVGVRGVREE